MESLIQLCKIASTLVCAGVLALVFFYAFRRGNQQQFDRAASLPLDDGFTELAPQRINSEKSDQ